MLPDVRAGLAGVDWLFVAKRFGSRKYSNKWMDRVLND
jgi:hypothetical protein